MKTFTMMLLGSVIGPWIGLAVAQDVVPPGRSAPSAPAAGEASAGTTGSADKPATEVDRRVGGYPRDGFILVDEGVYLRRGATLEKVTKAIILPNGARVVPNGMLTLAEGTITALRPEHILSLNGELFSLPVPAESVAGSAAIAGVSDYDGVVVSGTETFITRNGVTHRVTKEIALDSGLRIRANGTARLPDGGEVTLRPKQFLTLDGRIVTVP